MSHAYQQMQDYFGPQEDLDPELQGYVYDGHFGLSIQHPLVYSILHSPVMNGHANKQLQQKREALVKAEAAQDWHTYVFLHERPWRLKGFQDVMDQMPDAYYWELLGIIWIDSENIRQNSAEWFKLLRSKRGSKEAIMNDDEREELAELPTVIPVYQGHTARRHDGWSWTTARHTAVWFGKRFSMLEKSAPMLTTGTINRDDVLAYFSRRGESEILINRRKVTITKTVKL